MTKKFFLLSLCLIMGLLFLNSTGTGTEIKKNVNQSPASPATDTIKVTFIELGSTRCIPCKKMQPILEEIEKEYTGQVKVIFYDIWTDAGKPYAQQYNVKMIPTQVFLDKNGKEYFRHVGFFPKEELVEVLKKQGVK